MAQLVTFTLFHIRDGKKLAALRAFGLLRQRLGKVPGLKFGKALGCGKGKVFSIMPDWGRFALMCVWEDESAVKAFAQSPVYKALSDCSVRQEHMLLLPFMSKGTWSMTAPFDVADADNREQYPIAVLTRANINVLKLPGFIRQSYQTSDALDKAEGLLFSLGMGEAPLLRQATFTVWNDATAMKAFAYKDSAHIQAMKQKVRQHMFTEELFARFAVLKNADALTGLVP